MVRAFVIAVCLLAALPLAAQTATFKKVSGAKVEYQLKGQSWQKASVGLKIPAGTMVSTGFRSEALLDIDGTIVNVKPLTRLSIDQLAANAKGSEASVYLVAGKVQAEVKPGVGRETTPLTVKSPTATASVRGTGFEFDGVNLLVRHGEVSLSNQMDFRRSVRGGEFSACRDDRGVLQPVVVAKAAESPLGGADLDNEAAIGEYFDQTSIEQIFDQYGQAAINDALWESFFDEMMAELQDYFGSNYYLPGFAGGNTLVVLQ